MTSEPNAAHNDAGASDDDSSFAVDTRVVITGSAEQRPGIIIDDFGPPIDGAVVDLGEGRETRPRRWAVALDDGDLVFVDDDGLEPEVDAPATLEE
jgi:hypothetical protein